jgi:hypothetical protein
VLWKGWQTEGDLMCSGRVGRPRVTSCALEGLADRAPRHALWTGRQSAADIASISSPNKYEQLIDQRHSVSIGRVGKHRVKQLYVEVYGISRNYFFTNS